MLLNVEGVSVRFLGESGIHGLHLRPQVYEVLQPSDELKLDALNEFSQAIKLHQAGDYDKAVNLYKSVLQIDPNDVVSKRRLALAEKHEWVDLMGGQ
jgi:tetratricopeptide (TPR) repeat protein